MHKLVIAFLLLSQCFVACQRVQESAPTLEANLAGQAPACTQQASAHNATQLLFQSTDGGQTWQDISKELPADKPINCFLAQQGEVFLGAEDGLYRKSSTGTGNWQKEYTLNGNVTSIYSNQTGLYAYTQDDRLFQNISKDLWVPALTNMNNQMFRNIFEAADKTLFFGCDNGVFKSTDQGKNWNHVYDKGWMIDMVESNGVLLCTSQEGIMRSTDGGEHWEVVISEGGVGIQVEVIDGGFAAIAYNTTSETRRVRISADGGKTWQAIDAGLPPSANIASIKQVGKYFFCGHPEGVYRSNDQGKTWELVLPKVGKKVFNLTVSGNVLYAVPQDAGC